MDTGVYESLLTEQLNAQLGHHPDYGTVDEARHALTITRHLAPIIVR